ncbi:hypothetical protein F5H01DRAFT_353739 [Linnemannia elongata]|nr:hypothetical protein F5H01DRAFT_353739 [Linnemannia elongata]
MLTTQIQVLLYVGNIQVISCSVFVPVPSIVVKSHQTLEAILPYLPLSLTTTAETEDILLQSGPDPLLPQPALPAPPGPDSLSSTTSISTALATSSSSPHSTALVLSSRQDITSPSHPHRNNSTNNNNNNQRRSSSSNSNRISPDSSIPATTCIKISLHPTPSFKFVKPKCPHQHQKNRNRRHFQQQQQQQQHPSSSHSHSHSHSRSHSHSHSHSHDHGRSHRSDSYRHSNSNNSTTTMASLEYPQQTSTTATAAAAAVGGTVTVKFTYPVPSTNSSTPVPELVQVTGTFNSWQRSQPLTCNQDQTFFEGDIPIDIASLSQETDNKKQEDPNRKKILFKFVLDGQSWVTDPGQEVERDHAGNLNNVLFITNPLATATSTTVDTKDDAPTPPAPAVVAAEVKTETTETEEEKAARLKQEAEDDETIRQLGGGMWGAPYFAVNDPAELPEHFPAAAEDSATKEAEVTPAPVTPAAATPLTTTTVEKEKEAKETVAEKVDAPAPAAVEPVVQVAQTTVESSPAPEQPEQPKEEEVEDEDDKIIKALGGGMWGTPFFKVNDPTALPEHFQEALVANAAAATISASLPSPAVESEEVTDKDGHNIHIVKDEITTTVGGGKLIETVVETTEDTIIEAADGTFLEESITTSVEDTISGVIDEEVTEIIETIEEEEAPSSAAAEVQGTQVVVEDEGAIEFVETILEQTDADDTIIVPSAGTLTPPEVTMTEIETTTSVQGEDGVETTIVEDTLTFSEGPEVDAGSLHSPTTGVKPVTQGESVIVEQSPEVVVAASAPSSGDAKPSVDESVEPLPLPSLSSTTVNTTATAATPSTVVEPSTPIPSSNNNNNKDLQDAESAVVLLPHAGDAKPTADLSVTTTVLTPTPVVETKSTLPDHLVPGAEPASLTTTAPVSAEKGGENMEKSEKRKSFWKKIKKALS